MAQLHIDGKDEAYNIEDKPIIVGRSSKCDITMSDSHFSRHHFEVGKSGDKYYIKDLNSFNGTLLNEKKITEHVIEDSDIITVGKMRFIFSTDKQNKNQLPRAFVLIGKPKQWQQKIPLKLGKNTIGRKKHNDIHLNDDQASSAHAEIYVDEGGYKLQDLGSRNGTIVNQKRLQPKKIYKIQHGDMLQIGTNFCLLQVPNYKKVSKEKKAKKSQVLIPIVFSTIFVSLFAAVYFLHSSLQDNSFITGNLVDNFSFEEDSGWNYKFAQRLLKEKDAKTGKYYLNLKKADEIEYWESIAIEYGKNYRVSCWLRYQVLGKIAIKVSWKCENEASYIIETYTPFLNGNIAKWEELFEVIVPPPYAKSFNISVIVRGKVTNVDIDHLTVIAVDESPQIPDEKIVEDVYNKITMDATGNVNVFRKNKFVFGSAHFKIWQQDKIILHQTFSNGDTSKENSKLFWKGKEKIHVGYEIVEDGIKISYALPKEIDLDEKQIQCSFHISTAYASEMQVIKNTEVFLANIDNFSKQEDVRQIVWQEQQLGFLYSQAGIASIENVGNALVLTQRFNNLQNHNFVVKVKTNYEKDREKLLELRGLAKEYEQQQLFGKAYTSYRNMLGNFFVYEYKISPQGEIERIVKLFEKDQKQARLLLEEAQFFKQSSKFDTCISFCQGIYSKWQEMYTIAELDKILALAKAEKEDLRLQKKQYFVENLMTRAENFAVNEQSYLAILCYKQVLAYTQDLQLQNDINSQITKLEKKAAGE
ncbi:FHA domain-containing protein [Candidatus Uabimicrobium sp. HlEnr_7]|uniref:FHA domain-containing protein n=1 Tax=Candidatus Uabimicrobium helgolandensis TaxID=3095367 RepID=UPI0035571AB0